MNSKEVSTELAEMNEYKTVAIELAKSDLIPLSFKKPQDAWYAILYGRELGLSPIYALNNVTVINNRPGLSADAMLAICKRSPEYGGCTIEDTATECKVTMKRKYASGVEDERVVTFSIEDAQKAGLLNSKSQMYQKYPKRMLKARAVAFACRDLFQDTLAGIYAPEEIEELHPVTETPDYEVVDEVTQEPVSKVEIAKAVKRCVDLMSSFPMMGNKSIEYRQAIKDAGANNNLTKLNEIEAELEAMKQKVEAAAAKDKQKPEIVVEPEPEERQDTPEEAKKKEIVAMFEKMSKAGNFNTVHFSNSMKKRLGVTYDGNDWKAALIRLDIPIATMNKGLEHWKAALKFIERKTEFEAKVNALPDSIDKEQLLAGLKVAKTKEDLDFLQEAYDGLLLQ